VPDVQNFNGGRRPPDTHQELSICSDANFHLFFFEKFLPVSLLDALAHGARKRASLFQQAQSGVLHQMLGIDTGMTGDLRKLRFLLRGEMYFHRPSE
jgi:hypothetical protein